MLPFAPPLLLLLLMAALAPPTPCASQELQVRGHRTQREAKQDTIKVLVSGGCVSHGDTSHLVPGGQELELAPGSPLVLTHQIKLVPSGSGSGPGSCGCESDFAALRERLERLEREVSALRDKCGGADGGCCSSEESQGAGCSIKPKEDECPDECSDQGRCVDGRCECFPGFSGPDCSDSNCPGNCHHRGRCVAGQCVCDPGFSGPDCSGTSCPDACRGHGRCVDAECVCDPGFAGADCSEMSCPANCHHRGRCVDGQCVCDEGFRGADCSEQTCPNDCNGRGKCVDGKCVCSSDFTGDDCADDSCPGHCGSRGRCVNAQCVCDDGFTGAECGEKTCPNNCSGRGRCVEGKCVCSVGSAGPDCSEAKACPGNCTSRGRCIKGRCVCRRGFTGPDCSRCEDGRTGPTCDTVMSGVSQLRTQDVTESSVTLLWSQPAVQYDSYLLTFSSQKDRDQQVEAQVDGGLSSFTQTGLAAGQQFSATITGEVGGRRGAQSSTEFMTLISGPTDLRVVKMTSTSAVVQWDRPQGEVHRYRLSITPSDGAGKTQEVTVPGDQDSAHIGQLEAGRSYDIILVAEKGASQSQPATTQVVPGNSSPRVTTAALTTQVRLAPRQEDGDLDQELNPSPEKQVSDQQGRSEDEPEADSVRVGGIDGPNKDSPSLVERSKPPVSRTKVVNGTRPKHAERLTLSRKPKVPGPVRFLSTRVVPGGSKVSRGPLKKPLMGEKKKVMPKKSKPDVTKIETRTIDTTVTEAQVEASSTERKDEQHPAVTSGTDSETQRGSEEPPRQPDVSGTGQENDTAPVSSERTGTSPGQEKKCLNKVKVTHIRLAHQDRVGGCQGDGTVLVGNPLVSDRSTSDSKLSSAETNLDSSPDTLRKLLRDTYDSLNITTFSVHLSEPSDLSDDEDAGRTKMLTELKHLSSFSSSSPSLPKSQSSSSSSSSSTPSPLQVSSSSPPSLTPSSPSPSSSSSFSSDKPDSFGNKEQNADKTKNTASDTASPEERQPSTSGEAGAPPLHHTPPARGFIRRPRPVFGLFQNRTHPKLRGPHRPQGDIIPRRESGTRDKSTNESLPSSASEESSPVKMITLVRDASGDKDGPATPASSGHDQKVMLTERGRIPVRPPTPKGGYVRRPFPNMAILQNRTRPDLRLMTRPIRPLSPETKTQRVEVQTTSSPPDVKAESTQPIGEDREDRAVVRTSSTRMSSEQLNQALRAREEPLSQRPTKVQYYRRSKVYAGAPENTTRPHLRQPQYPRRGLMLNPLPVRKLNGDAVGSQTSQQEKGIPSELPGIPYNQLGEQDVPRPTQRVEVRIRQTGEQETAGVSSRTDVHNTAVSPQTNKLENGERAPIQTTTSGEEETGTLLYKNDSDVNNQRVNTAKYPASTVRGKQNTQKTSSDSRDSRTVSLPKRQPPSGSLTGHRTQLRNPVREEDPKTNHTVKRLFDTKTGQTRKAASKPVMGSDVASAGVTREALDHVGVRNRTSDGFTLVWDSPEGKYKNFVVTRKREEKDETPNQKGIQRDQQRRQEASEREDEKLRPINEPGERSTEEGNPVSASDHTHIPVKQTVKPTVKPATGSDKSFREVLPGSARSLHFEDLPPQTEYTVTLLGKGPGLLSRLHKLVISTGPEPPTDIAFSEVTENSLTVSWTKPKTPVSGFKVTYTHSEDEEPVSVSLDSEDSSVGLSQLSPGSTYEVSILSILGLDESDPVQDLVSTLPDPPTHLRAVNVTDTKALLLWRPALASVDKYTIVYGSGSGSELRITVSGNAAEQQLSGLEASTTYTVTISSQLGGGESPAAATSFTTSRGSDGDVPRDLQADHVTPRSARLSWRAAGRPAAGYRLTYQTGGREVKEVLVDSSVNELNLTGLDPGSKYTVQLQAEAGGRFTSSVSTEFTTGALRFPFPTDCSQELLNGFGASGEVEIFPQGNQGASIRVYCDMETDGGGWTVFQRRKDGSVDFFRGWRDYVKGFGDLSGEFWLGLESLHNLTTLSRMSLRVDLRDGDDSVFAKYSTFAVARRNYRLSVGGYSGDAGDSLSYHNNRVFSTKDRDPSPFITRCAMSYRGGWWYQNCHQANLNGLYGIDVKHQGIIWTSWKGKDTSIAFTEMKMRPASFSPAARG
ncbi:tenascin-X isoform X1 [Platichthys flesus]|uniref:tenascin-X isoform X1 n=1 Tax=Platichthys flesus TaxID=8260 RepID=UPI002DBAA8F3|nr:tenascin-X isoform X1 [Platichthys flesus]